MTFKQLIQTNTWPNISAIFLAIYPDAAANMEGYKTVFEKLVVMDPAEMDMSIVISKEKDDFDDEEYIGVSGLYNNPKNEEEHYSQGIEFTPWRNWLGMDISAESLANFSEQEIIVHCLYEMTFVGFSEEDIQKVLSKHEKSIGEYKTLTEEERSVSTASIEELFKELNEDDSEN